MAKKTNTVKNGIDYFRIRRKVGRKINSRGEWITDYKDFYGKTKREAEEKYQAFMNRQGTSANACFGELVDAYIRDFLIPDSSLKESTKERYIAAYRNNLQNHSIVRKGLDEISGMDLQKVYNSLSCGASSIRAANKLLSKFFKYALSEGITSRDITANITLPKVPKLKETDEAVIEVWTQDELQKILTESVDHRLHFLFVLAAGSGLRISELLALKYDDIQDGLLRVRRQVYPDPVFDEKGKIIDHVQSIRELKTGSSVRSVPLNDEILIELEKYRQWHLSEMMKRGYRTEYLFTTNTGKLYSQPSIRQACRRFYKRIGVTQRGFHCFRHTYGTRLAAAGVPIQTVCRLLGHSDISVTSKYYVDVSDTEKSEAVQKLQLLAKDI